jgi:hypothetical protein
MVKADYYLQARVSSSMHPWMVNYSLPSSLCQFLAPLRICFLWSWTVCLQDFLVSIKLFGVPDYQSVYMLSRDVVEVINLDLFWRRQIFQLLKLLGPSDQSAAFEISSGLNEVRNVQCVGSLSVLRTRTGTHGFVLKLFTIMQYKAYWTIHLKVVMEKISSSASDAKVLSWTSSLLWFVEETNFKSDDFVCSQVLLAPSDLESMRNFHMSTPFCQRLARDETDAHRVSTFRSLLWSCSTSRILAAAFFLTMESPDSMIVRLLLVKLIQIIAVAPKCVLRKRICCFVYLFLHRYVLVAVWPLQWRWCGFGGPYYVSPCNSCAWPSSAFCQKGRVEEIIPWRGRFATDAYPGSL